MSAVATTSRARDSCASIVASSSPASVRAITPPRPILRSACTLKCSIPPSSLCKPATASPISSRSSGLTTSVTCRRSTRCRSASRATSINRSGCTDSAPARISSARRSASRIASPSTAWTSSSRNLCRPCRASASAASAGAASSRAAASPAALPCDSPVARASSRIRSASSQAADRTSARLCTAPPAGVSSCLKL